MSDHADIVREALSGATRGSNLNAAVAALDALVAERDEYLQMVFADMASENKARRSYNAQGIRMRAEAAEAEVARLKARLRELGEEA